MRLSIFFLLIALNVCGQQPANDEHSINSQARQLNDSALSIVRNTQDFAKAITLLDQATKIDSNYYLAFWNKISFQSELKQFDNALVTAKNLNRIKPESPDYFFIDGLIYDKIHDTISSQKYFIKAEVCYDKILDTMNKASKEYDNFLMNKAVNLILIGQQQKGNNILEQLYDKKRWFL